SASRPGVGLPVEERTMWLESPTMWMEPRRGSVTPSTRQPSVSPEREPVPPQRVRHVDAHVEPLEADERSSGGERGEREDHDGVCDRAEPDGGGRLFAPGDPGSRRRHESAPPVARPVRHGMAAALVLSSTVAGIAALLPWSRLSSGGETRTFTGLAV